MQKISQNSPNVKQWQDFMSKAPMGIVYSGPRSGEMNNDLVLKIKQLEKQLQIITGNPVVGQIIDNEGNLKQDTKFASNLIDQYINYQQPIKQQEVGAQKSLTEQDKQVIIFKKYLAQKGAYSGNVNDPKPDQHMIQILQLLEIEISKGLSIVTGAPANSAVGMIWRDNRINPETSPDDIETAIELLNQKVMKKEGQAVLDTLVYHDAEDPHPVAFNWQNSPIGYGTPGQILENVDPLDNERQGVMNSTKVPKELVNDKMMRKLVEKHNIDDRLYQLLKNFY